MPSSAAIFPFFAVETDYDLGNAGGAWIASSQVDVDFVHFDFDSFRLGREPIEVDGFAAVLPRAFYGT